MSLEAIMYELRERTNTQVIETGEMVYGRTLDFSTFADVKAALNTIGSPFAFGRGYDIFRNGVFVANTKSWAHCDNEEFPQTLAGLKAAEDFFRM